MNRHHEARLNWLLTANAQAAAHRRLFRNSHEEEIMLLMRHPLTMRGAYARFGLLLGTIPPASLFYGTMLHVGWRGTDANWTALLFCILMNIMCAIIGMTMGSLLSGAMEDIERGSWSQMLFVSPLVGVLWGVVTGGAGGLIFFIIGAFFGMIFAVPVGMAGFLLFAIHHRSLAHGGMIEARHFWPLACGIALVLGALLQNLWRLNL